MIVFAWNDIYKATFWKVCVNMFGFSWDLGDLFWYVGESNGGQNLSPHNKQALLRGHLCINVTCVWWQVAHPG